MGKRSNLVSKGGWQGFLSRRSVCTSLGDKSIAKAELIQQVSPSLPPRDSSRYRKTSGLLLLAREGASGFAGDSASQTKVKHQNEGRAALLPLCPDRRNFKSRHSLSHQGVC